MSVEIDGLTRVIAHIGVPTASFRAPQIWNPWFARTGENAVVVPMGIGPEDFPAMLPALFRMTNIAGALITMPHKIRVLDLLDAVSPQARIAGACNAVRAGKDGRIEGDMFDGAGFVGALRAADRRIAGASALVVGAGGVGSAIAAALAAGGAARIALFDRDDTAMEGLAGRLSGHFPAVAARTGSADPAGHDIVVNATPLGMAAGDPLPLDTGRLSPGALVGDVVLSAEETPFLAAARARGCATQSGTEMLLHQIPAYLDFFGFPPATVRELRETARIRY